MTADTLIDARNLSRYYDVPGGLFSKKLSIRALNDASFKLNAGRTFAVLTWSGCAFQYTIIAGIHNFILWSILW